MKILALEFSSKHRSVAVAKRGAGDCATCEITSSGGRSIKSLAMIEQALREAGLEREQITVLAIGIGPGSYTGIRLAIALAQGWQLACPVKLLAISSAECLAAQAHAQKITGEIAVVIDAQRGDFYLVNYELDSKGWKETKPMRLAREPEVQACIDAGNIVIGPESHRFPTGRLLFPQAATLAQLALDRTHFVSAETLEPLYLRETKFVKAPLPQILPF